ncbi:MULTISPECIES: hypothetical protein [unclassified Proteiniphilum]|jgi:hypothetical protein|uniref:hypothetical protein n=2 Tax=Proteiniphilum TaxID=294702 RepID=UPI002579C47B|nr:MULTISPECIES: hypothetical protein [unclassified Proteiniphilum]
MKNSILPYKLKIVNILMLCAFMMVPGYADAGDDPWSFIKELPPIPVNICGERLDVAAKWVERLSALKDRMVELQVKEKWEKDDALKDAKSNMALFEPSGGELQRKYFGLLKEIELTERQAESKLNEILLDKSKNIISVETKYQQILEPLNNELRNAIAQGKDTSNVRDKIKNLVAERCLELGMICREFLVKYRNMLGELVSCGVKINELQDEANRIAYQSYNVKTSYGLWLDYIMMHTGELMKIYDYNSYNITELYEF